jgi:hypothetical protein
LRTATSSYPRRSSSTATRVRRLRHYAHATPLDDVDVADELDRRLNEAVG